MSIGHFALLSAAVIFTGMNVFARYICNTEPLPRYRDDVPIYIFFNMMAIILFGATFTLMVKSVEDHCVNVVEIGGCNKYSCGVRMSDGSIDRMGTPVIGEQKCFNRLEYRFW